MHIKIHEMYFTVFIVTENEDSDPSEESSKSKSSQEEKNSQGQRQRGTQMIQHFFPMTRRNTDIH